MKERKKTIVLQGVRLDERIIPVPASISTEAHAMLHTAVRDGTPLNALFPTPSPQDHEAWRQMQIAADRYYAETLPEAVKETKGNLETLHFGTTTVHVATPENIRLGDCVFIDLHGGALVFGGGHSCRESARIHAERNGMICYGIDYRMPPDHPYPATLDDCIVTYRHLIQRYGANRVVFSGRSAGGNLAMAAIMRARDEGRRRAPFPGSGSH